MSNTFGDFEEKYILILGALQGLSDLLIRRHIWSVSRLEEKRAEMGLGHLVASQYGL